MPMLPVLVTIDPADPDPSAIAGYLAEIACRMDERPEPMRVTFNAPEGVELDLDDDGLLVVRSAGYAPKRVDLRRRWIADHPVPLKLSERPFLRFFRRRARLDLIPTTANRFHARRPKPTIKLFLEIFQNPLAKRPRI